MIALSCRALSRGEKTAFLRRWPYLVCVLAALFAAPASALDHQYAQYSGLLGRHVRWLQGGSASVVDYAGLKTDHAQFRSVLSDLSLVTQAEFDNWSSNQQKAFLINAYNGFTLELILSRYPDLKSIRDLGSFIRSPWKTEFFELLGKKRHLDWIEHEVLRPRFRDARIHFAVNCASVGCPALRPEAYTADKLDVQLDDQMRRFLSDRTRNRFDGTSGTLYVSEIFRWYHEDFESKGQPIKRWFVLHAKLLADSPGDQARLSTGNFRLDYLSYDWSLNDADR